MIGYKGLLLALVTWNHIIMWKLVVLDRNTWNRKIMQSAYTTGPGYYRRH